MRITSKGQVTIPIDVRERYGLHPGDEVAFVDGPDGPQVVKPPGAPTRGQRVVERLRGSATAELHMTTDEIMALLRGDD